MPYKNKHLSDYSEQIKAGVPKEELIDWSKVPEVIKPQKHKTRGVKTRARTRKNKNGWHPEELKIEAVALYAALGNIAEVSRVLDVNAATLRAWKQTEWWNEMLNRVHDEKDEELDSKFSKTIDKAMDEINDRLENGDFVLNAKTGQVSRVKPKMRDIAYVTSMQIDKRQLLRGRPTSRTEKVSSDERLNKLAKEFARFVGSKDITEETEVIEYADS